MIRCFKPLVASSRQTVAVIGSQRFQATLRHLSGSTAAEEAPVLFKGEGYTRTYILNRPKALNTQTETIMDMLDSQIKAWNGEKLCKVIIARGNGRAFCAGGDIKYVVLNAADPGKQHHAVRVFHKEFELNFLLATLSKPYVAVMDGYTMGGGAGLALYAPFRIVTEASIFAMPEVKIGYCPDVGASYFLPRLDGELGTYLALTSNHIQGRTILEFGLATHFVPRSRLPELLTRLSSLADYSPAAINKALEEYSTESSPGDPPGAYMGERRMVLDACFSHDNVDDIISDLQGVAASSGPQAQWAQETLTSMLERSPTSLRVALHAIRRGKHLELADALQMEMGIATAFCTGATRDIITGVMHLLVHKAKGAAAWSPPTLQDTPQDIVRNFFDDSPYLTKTPRLRLDKSISPGDRLTRYALPTEATIQAAVKGSLPGSGSFALTPEELIAFFEGRLGQKHGLKEKIMDVIDRKCEVKGSHLIWKD